MTFLYPKMLWGLLAILIPIIIHFFNFRQTIRVYFSNVRLLKEVQTSSSSFKSLKNLLVLLTRILAIFCLVLAFAQPISKDAKGLAGNVYKIYCDNSLSMQNTLNNTPYLNLAINKIDEMLNTSSPTTKFSFLENDFSEIDRNVILSSQLKDRLTTLGYSQENKTAAEILSKQLESNKISNRLYWFSDFQKSTLGDLQKLKIDSITKLNLIPINNPEANNVYIDSVWLDIPYIQPLKVNKLMVRLKQSGNRKSQKIFLKLTIGGLPSSSGEAQFNESEFAQIALDFSVRENKNYQAELSFEDNALDFDNKYYLMLNASPKIKIVQVVGSFGSENYVSALLGNNEAFQFNSYSIHSINYDQLNEADLIIFNQLESISESLKENIFKLVQNGVSLVMIPSENGKVEEYRTVANNFGFRDLVKNSQDTTKVEIEAPLNNPFYSGVFEKQWDKRQLLLPKAVRVWIWNGGISLLKFSSENSFLSTTKYAKGKFYFFSTPFKMEYTDFMRHSFFVPTFLNIAMKSKIGDALAYSFDEQIEFKNSKLKENSIIKLKQNQVELLPEQSFSNNTISFNFPKNSYLEESQKLNAGFYSIISNNENLGVIAVNNNKKESETAYYSNKELKELFKGANVYENVFDESLLNQFNGEEEIFPYWKYFLIAALIFLLTESLIIRFLKPNTEHR